jgi:hypothetical protein
LIERTRGRDDVDLIYVNDNGAGTNVAATVYLVIILLASLAAIPLMIVTGAGQ